MTSRVWPLFLKRLSSRFLTAGPGFFLGSMAYTRLNGLTTLTLRRCAPSLMRISAHFFAAVGQKRFHRPLDG
jgi:hypothetical protein